MYLHIIGNTKRQSKPPKREQIFDDLVKVLVEKDAFKKIPGRRGYKGFEGIEQNFIFNHNKQVFQISLETLIKNLKQFVLWNVTKLSKV